MDFHPHWSGFGARRIRLVRIIRTQTNDDDNDRDSNTIDRTLSDIRPSMGRVSAERGFMCAPVQYASRRVCHSQPLTDGQTHEQASARPPGLRDSRTRLGRKCLAAFGWKHFSDEPRDGSLAPSSAVVGALPALVFVAGRGLVTWPTSYLADRVCPIECEGRRGRSDH